ncbi:hypothetical protein C8J57DRAFT_1234195 [Mycena rebaudengoi]|nr:hypothetical protein C8J57DRAFT_1234195 [Mycena rebaudengoi]
MCPPGGGNALPPVEDETASGGDADGVSVDGENLYLARVEIVGRRGCCKRKKRASDGQRRTMTVEGAEYTACTGEGGETKTPGSGGCMSRERRDSESATPAAELELQRDRRHLRGPHKEVQVRAESRGGTRAQWVESVKEGWGDVHASTGRRETTTPDLRVRPQNDIPPTEPAPKNPGSPIEKTKKEKTGKRSLLTHENGPGRREQRNRRERTDGAVVLEDGPRVVDLVLLHLGFRRRRDVCAVALRLMHDVVVGSGGRGRGGVGGSGGSAVPKGARLAAGWRCDGRTMEGWIVVEQKSAAEGENKEEEWMVGRPRTLSTSRSAENCAHKPGALESCVALRKWRRVDVRMKERAPAMRVRHQRTNEKACTLSIRRSTTMREGVSIADGYKTDGVLCAHVHARHRTPSNSMTGFACRCPPCAKESGEAVMRIEQMVAYDGIWAQPHSCHFGISAGDHGRDVPCLNADANMVLGQRFTTIVRHVEPPWTRFDASFYLISPPTTNCSLKPNST